MHIENAGESQGLLGGRLERLLLSKFEILHVKASLNTLQPCELI